MFTVDAKLLQCNEYMDTSEVRNEGEIRGKKCTYSFVKFSAFEDVTIAPIVIRESNFDNDVLEIDVTSEIANVEFIESAFPNLPPNLFTSFENLKIVSCKAVGLTLLSKSDFRAAANLEEFSSSSNYLKSLEKLLFNDCKMLQLLDLAGNEIEFVDETAFSGLTVLRKLLLNDNKLQNLSRDAFQDLIGLEEINLSFNQLRTVEAKLFESCKLLNYIYLSDNQIENIADGALEAIKEIRFLQLSNNELSVLRMNISASALYADSNKLTSVDLRSVGYLSFFNNSITDVSFSDKRGVLSLNVSTNRLTAGSLKSIAEFGEMRSLDLSFNNLGRLNVSTFLYMPHLQILNLQSTSLGEIGYGLFTHQTSLEQLDLSYNKLNGFDLTRLRLKALTTLFIEGNGISSIEHGKLKELLPALVTFGFSDNAWSCSYLSTLVSFLDTNGIEIYRLVMEKTKSNVDGIACSERSEKVNEHETHEDKLPSVNSIKHHQLPSHDNELKEISARFAALSLHVNETNEKFVLKTDLIEELNVIKSALASLRQEISGRKQQAEANESVMVKNDGKLERLAAEMKHITETVDELTRSRNSSSISFVPQNTAENPRFAIHDDILVKIMISTVFFIVCGFTCAHVLQMYTRCNHRRSFRVRSAYSESGSINENIL